MKNKKQVVLALLVFAGGINSAMADNYTLDPAHTFSHFAVNHLGFSTIHGRFNSSKGKLSIDLAKKTGSVSITIDAASVDTGFKKRDDHLRSPDFFNVNEFPEITFKSTKVKFMGKDKASVMGNITIKGVTKPITLSVTHIKCGTHPMNKKQVCGFDATTSLKRSDFGVKYGIPAISDEIKITLDAEAVKS